MLPSANAYVIQFAAGPVTLTGGAGPVNVRASFDVNSAANTITIQLLNLEKNPIDVNQLISGIEFTMANLGSGSSAMTLVSEIETFVQISANTKPSAASAANSWIADVLSSTRLTLCTVCDPLNGNNDPSELLIGGPPDATKANSNKYTAANGTIAGNGTNNPFILASGDTYSTGPLSGLKTTPVWKISLAAGKLLPSTYVSSMTVYFGTTYGAFSLLETDPQAPEPVSIVVVSGGLILLAVLGRRRRSG